MVRRFRGLLVDFRGGRWDGLGRGRLFLLSGCRSCGGLRLWVDAPALDALRLWEGLPPFDGLLGSCVAMANPPFCQL